MTPLAPLFFPKRKQKQMKRNYEQFWAGLCEEDKDKLIRHYESEKKIAPLFSSKSNGKAELTRDYEPPTSTSCCFILIPDEILFIIMGYAGTFMSLLSLSKTCRYLNHRLMTDELRFTSIITEQAIKVRWFLERFRYRLWVHRGVKTIIPQHTTKNGHRYIRIDCREDKKISMNHIYYCKCSMILCDHKKKPIGRITEIDSEKYYDIAAAGLPASYHNEQLVAEILFYNKKNAVSMCKGYGCTKEAQKLSYGYKKINGKPVCDLCTEADVKKGASEKRKKAKAK